MIKRVTEPTIDDRRIAVDASKGVVFARVPELRHGVRLMWAPGLGVSLSSSRGEGIDAALRTKLALEIYDIAMGQHSSSR
jgi:hypothetical protein